MRTDGRDEWATPYPIYKFICARWDCYPTVDLFCDESNIKCPWGYTAEIDALTLDWSKEHSCGWLQPPYSQPILGQAIEKAIEQAFQGFTTLFLLPARVDQPWYHKWIKQFDHDFWEGRIHFEPLPWIVPSSPREGNVHGVIRL